MVADIKNPDFEKFIDSSIGIKGYSILPIAGDVSMRRYYRITNDNNSWVLMEWEPFKDDATYPFLSIQKYFKENGVHVPEVYHFDKEKGYFLIEDLGDLTLERKFWEIYNPQNITPYYHAAIDELCKVHKLIFNEKKPSRCHAYSIEFDNDKFVWEMNYTLKNLIKGYLKLDLSKQDEEALQKEFLQIAKKLTSLPQVICHRDYHSRNIMLKGTQLYLIDFQDARLGPPQYDLVSLLHDSYVKMGMNYIEEYVDYYLEKMPEILSQFKSRQNYMEAFELQTVQRCFKACGTFSAVYLQREDFRYLKYLPRTIKKVRKGLEKLKDYPVLTEIMDSINPPKLEKGL